ncbi:MAG: DUF58 domain-containing protein [Acidimicrobiia bacterium]|nr:DUF58 domain-containing protein [Acidimicrobiia bacterium]
MAAAETAPPVLWPSGPPTDQVREVVRTLELTINRRLAGILHGNYQGLTPGHGSEPGESRPYQPGDDVRRIDWNVTARTTETHVREQIADRDLEAWLVVDSGATMRFGTSTAEKAQIALAAAAAIGFLTARNQNRLGAVLAAGPYTKVLPPRFGRDQVRAILSALADTPAVEGLGPTDLAAAIDKVGVLARRRGFVTVIADFAGTGWIDPLARLGMRHDLLAIAVHDPRERDVPPIGLVELVDPATGRHREVRVTSAIQQRYADAAAAQVARRDEGIRRSGADAIELATDADWLQSIVRHVRRKRVQAVNAQVLRTR